jgi:hypothetical protein
MKGDYIMAAKGYIYLSDAQVNSLRRAAPNIQDPDMLPMLIDNALSILVTELPTNIPQANVASLVSDLAAKMATAAFTDAAVTSKLITGFVSGAGAVGVGDTLLQAINKINGNDALKLTASKLVNYTGTVAAGSATPSAVVTGLLGTDTILAVSQKAANANSLPLIGFGTPTADALPLVYSADPGANGTICVTVLKA